MEKGEEKFLEKTEQQLLNEVENEIEGFYTQALESDKNFSDEYSTVRKLGKI